LSSIEAIQWAVSNAEMCDTTRPQLARREFYRSETSRLAATANIIAPNTEARYFVFNVKWQSQPRCRVDAVSSQFTVHTFTADHQRTYYIKYYIDSYVGLNKVSSEIKFLVGRNYSASSCSCNILSNIRFKISNLGANDQDRNLKKALEQEAYNGFKCTGLEPLLKKLPNMRHMELLYGM
jgi:hypothetical protein